MVFSIKINSTLWWLINPKARYCCLSEETLYSICSSDLLATHKQKDIAAKGEGFVTATWTMFSNRKRHSNFGSWPPNNKKKEVKCKLEREDKTSMKLNTFCSVLNHSSTWQLREPYAIFITDFTLDTIRKHSSLDASYYILSHDLIWWLRFAELYFYLVL